MDLSRWVENTAGGGARAWRHGRAALGPGTDVTATDEDGRTALHWAAGQGHGDSVTLLLDWGADVAMKDGDGRTALHLAAMNGHWDAVAPLLDQGADIAANDTMQSYIMCN